MDYDYGLMHDTTANFYNSGVFFKYMHSLGLEEYTTQLEQSLATQSHTQLVQSLKGITENRKINLYFPTIADIAKNLIPNPQKYSDFKPLNFIVERELSYYGLISTESNCTGHYDLNFRDPFGPFSHQVWKLSNNVTAHPKLGDILLYCRLDYGVSVEIELIKKQNIKLFAFFSNSKYRTTAEGIMQCPVCQPDTLTIWETNIPNDQEILTKILKEWKNMASKNLDDLAVIDFLR